MFVKQIDMAKALELAAKGMEIKVLAPIGQESSWEADRPPENVVMFRRMIKSMCTIFHLRILGKVTIVDEKGRRW